MEQFLAELANTTAPAAAAAWVDSILDQLPRDHLTTGGRLRNDVLENTCEHTNATQNG